MAQPGQPARRLAMSASPARSGLSGCSVACARDPPRGTPVPISTSRGGGGPCRRIRSISISMDLKLDVDELLDATSSPNVLRVRRGTLAAGRPVGPDCGDLDAGPVDACRQDRAARRRSRNLEGPSRPQVRFSRPPSSGESPCAAWSPAARERGSRDRSDRGRVSRPKLAQDAGLGLGRTLRLRRTDQPLCRSNPLVDNQLTAS
jgi:hypothetical protein